MSRSSYMTNLASIHSWLTSANHFLTNIVGWKRSSVASKGNDSKELPSVCLSANMAFSFSVWIKFTRNSWGSSDTFFFVSWMRWLYSSLSSLCILCITWSAILNTCNLVGKQFLSRRLRENANLWGKSVKLSAGVHKLFMPLFPWKAKISGNTNNANCGS